MMATSGVTAQDIVLNVTAASVIVVATIAMSNSTAASNAATTLQATDATNLSSLLGVAIERVGLVRTYTVTLYPPPPPTTTATSSPSSTSLTGGAQAQAQSASSTSQQDADLIVPLLIAVLVLLAILILATVARWVSRGRMSVRRVKRSDAPAGHVSALASLDHDAITLSNRINARIENESRRQ